MKILIILAILLAPATLESGAQEFYIEKWPVKIMQAGSFEYWMCRPGSKVHMVEKE